MPLKPGQTKDLKVEIEKLKGLKELEEKIKDLVSVSSGLSYGKSTVSAKLKKDFEALHAKVQSEIIETNNAIVKLKATQSKASPALDKLVKTIAKECSQALAQYRKTQLVLLRGIGHNSPTAFMGRSWNNREPKDSSARLQQIYDEALKSKGFKALRGNSIFTTTDDSFAGSYGTLYYIFPKNGSTYTWNKHNQDLVLDNSDQVLDVRKIEKITVDVENWYEKKYKKELRWYYEDAYEAMYDLNGFFKELKKLKYPKDIKLLDLINWDFIKNDIGPTATNFAAGLASGNEMMISGEYYAINTESPVAKYVMDALKIKPLNY